jgi:DNA (cytosine-5)-methyltransferase 1
MSNFRYIDLFAGIGGFHLALDKLGGQCVFASEIDLKAQTVYRANYEKSSMSGPIVGDIIPLTDPVVSALVPEHDLLAAGFPCQPFSKSGFQRGINETRGTLFYNIVKVLEERRPEFLLLENVRNLTGPRHTHTWSLIIRTLRDIGYRVSSQPTIFSPHLLPPHLGGSPQRRDRVYIFGHYVGPERAWELAADDFHVPYLPVDGWQPDSWNLEAHLLEDDTKSGETGEYMISSDRMLAIEMWEDFQKSVSPPNPDRRLPGFPIWEYALTASPDTTSENPAWKNEFLRKNSDFFIQNAPAIEKWRLRHPELTRLPMSYRKLEWQAGNLESIWDGALQFRPSGLRVKRPTYLPALVAMNQTSFIGARRRNITTREAARLQGFPDWFEFGEQPANDSYKQLGNAVSVGAVAYILEKFLELTETSLGNLPGGLAR